MNETVTVRLADANGKPGEPVQVPTVAKSDADWRVQLTEEQYRVTRHAGTERPFCGVFHDNHLEGRYDCVGCGLPLYQASAKFDSGTGWPSFFRPFADENVAVHRDSSHGMIRDEIVCARCGGHLGHVFPDGPAPTGMRHCLNSAALAFVPAQA